MLLCPCAAIAAMIAELAQHVAEWRRHVIRNLLLLHLAALIVLVHFLIHFWARGGGDLDHGWLHFGHEGGEACLRRDRRAGTQSQRGRIGSREGGFGKSERSGAHADSGAEQQRRQRGAPGVGVIGGRGNRHEGKSFSSETFGRLAFARR